MPTELCCVEQAREGISAAAELLGRDVAHPEVGDDDLDSAVAALFAVQHALSEYMDLAAAESDTARLTQVAALLVRSEHTQAVVVDAILARRAAKVLGAQDAVGRVREARSTAALVERAAAEAHHMGFDRILFSRIDHGTWLASSAGARARCPSDLGGLLPPKWHR